MSRQLVAVLVTISSILTSTACSASREPDNSELRLNLIQVTSLTGKSSYGVVVEIRSPRKLQEVEIRLRIPDGASGQDAGAPLGARYSGVEDGIARWQIDFLDGPALVGPFVFALNEMATPPGFAEMKWKGGSVGTSEVKVRQSGVAIGEGVLRSSVTTSSILIGRDTEITGYAAGISLDLPRAVLATRDPLDPPLPSEAGRPPVVMESHFRIEPRASSPIVLEMTAPRPLPPYALIRIEFSADGTNYASFKYGGRVGPLGDRIYVPILETGKYRALVDGDWYRNAATPMSQQVLDLRAMVTARAGQVAFEMKREFIPALVEVDSEETLTLLAIERSRPGTRLPESVPEGLSFNGLATCSIIACLGANAPFGAINFCDLLHDITACMPIDRPGEEVTVTVTGRDPLFQYCLERACYVPGRGIVEGGRVASSDIPVTTMIVGEEIIWSGVPVAA